jgi:hypothetical protein
MTSPRLRLWQVLRDEYESFHGARPIIAPNWMFQPAQLKHAVGLARRLHQPADEVSKYLFGKLSVTAQAELQSFDGKVAPSDELQAALLDMLNKLLDDPDLRKVYGERVVNQILTEAEVEEPETSDAMLAPTSGDKLRQINRWLLEETFPDEIESVDESITREYYKAISAQEHSAVCLSGGGIRSGTFNLGILQGLARHRLLGKFNYLSTVSGGGFSGGWLSAWIHRHPQGLDGVMNDLGKLPPVPPLEPEPEALGWLRSYSNFLSPKLGLFSADTWTLVATVLRNIFLNWLVFVPVLMAGLIFPRLWVAFITRRTLADVGIAEQWSIGIAFGAGMLALLYIGINLPSTRQRNRSQGAFLFWCLVPLLISAMALATFAARAPQSQFTFGNFFLYQLAIISLPWLACAILQYRMRRAVIREKITGKLARRLSLAYYYTVATLLIVGTQAVTAWLMLEAARAWGGAENQVGGNLLYACFAVPLLLLLMSFTGILLAGLTSNYTDDEDQEWWARAGAWVFIAVIGWSVVSVLVIYGPELLILLPERLSSGKIFTIEMWTAVGGVLSGVIAIAGGFSSKVAANDEEAKKSGIGGMIVSVLINVAAILFAVFIVIVLAILTNVLLAAFANGTHVNGPDVAFPRLGWFTNGVANFAAPIYHTDVIRQSPFRLLFLVGLILFVLGLFFGRLINTNKFSLHYLWRNRIIRAYLGASNLYRQPNLFTGFDSNDNVQMHELVHRERRLLHVLNFALNLVGGEKLAWQERKAESFSVSPLHCGNYRLGYRRSKEYGKRLKPGDTAHRQGISLGTSIAISGAFVSPNMGYMQSSPVIRFLMTLFNVRFGWWLGNTGRAGDGTKKTRTYDLDSPRFSVKPIVKEALGMTNDKSDYVYLSDGGHFENFGLYEMVLRRCRLIVVGDGTSDAEYTFESLGQSLRKIRIDFGIPIDFKKFMITKPSRDEKGVYAAVAQINYHCVDGGSPELTDGTLILIKPTLIGSEERDVLNYASQNGAFPQEFIGDQWFSESQFESYRALGSHIIDVLCSEPGKTLDDRKSFNTLAAFKDHVENNLSAISTPDILQKALEYIRGNGK